MAFTSLVKNMNERQEGRIGFGSFKGPDCPDQAAGCVGGICRGQPRRISGKADRLSVHGVKPGRSDTLD